MQRINKLIKLEEKLPIFNVQKEKKIRFLFCAKTIFWLGEKHSLLSPPYKLNDCSQY